MNIGVIIPCLNEENFIGQLLSSLKASILHSQYNSISVYLCDNGSTDDTSTIVNSFLKDFPRLNLLHEKHRGDGLAIKKAAEEAFETNDWIIGIDADCNIPLDFIKKWIHAIQDTSLPLLTGYYKFQKEFYSDFPNASRLKELAAPFNKLIIEAFGIINICGANHAVSKEFYFKLGGYTQPFIYQDGKKKSLAGSDWDFGLKSRMIHQEIGFVDVFNITSDRRASVDVRSFLLGIVYEGVFLSHRKRIKGLDISEEEIPEILNANLLRTIKHFALKPILAEPKLLSKPIVVELLGEQLISKIQTWILDTEIKDIYKDRNGFIYETLECFHKKFGTEVYQNIERKCIVNA